MEATEQKQTDLAMYCYGCGGFLNNHWAELESRRLVQVCRPCLSAMAKASSKRASADRDHLKAANAELIQALRCTLADLVGAVETYEIEDYPAHQSIKEARAALAEATK